MPRPLKTPQRSEIAPEDLPFYDKVVKKYQPNAGHDDQINLGPWMGTLAYWPQMAWNRAEISTYVRTAGERKNSYSHRDREFVDQVMMPYLKTYIVMSTHIPDALAVGIDIETIDALRHGRDEKLSPQDRDLAAYIRHVIDGEVTDPEWDRMEKRFGKRPLVELTIFITVLWMTMRQMQAFGQHDPTDAEIDAFIGEFKSGARKAPEDWKTRIR
jgi:hypothetical protein